MMGRAMAVPDIELPRRRYRPAARHAQPIDTSMSHIGFRCVRRETNGTNETKSHGNHDQR